MSYSAKRLQAHTQHLAPEKEASEKAPPEPEDEDEEKEEKGASHESKEPSSEDAVEDSAASN
jgi:hypothetical protein